MPGIFTAPANGVRERLFFLATPIGLQLLILALEVHMKRIIVVFASATLFAATAVSPVAAFTPQTPAAIKAISWLHTQQSSDGTVAGDASRTEETVWGLAANGVAIDSFATGGKTPIDSLRTHIASEEKTAGNIGSLVLAVGAAGLDPTGFAGRNLLQDLQCTYDPTTGAYNSQIFNDALAILAIPAGKAPQKAVSYIVAAQQTDGGWEFSPGFHSDTNTTAIVLMALKAAGGLTTTVKAKALVYLKTEQQPSGGFEYTAGTGNSDPDSDGLVIEGLLAAGEDPTATSWSIDGQNAVTDLLTFQYPNGGFGYSRPGSSASAAPDAFSTTQPLPALASKFLPVRAISGTMPMVCPAVAPSTQPTPPRPTTTTVPTLARTGAAPGRQTSVFPFALLTIGLIAIISGWRLRRRTQ